MSISEIGSIYPLETLDIRQSVKYTLQDIKSYLHINNNGLFLSLGREGFSIVAHNHPEKKKVLLPLYSCQTVGDPFWQLGWQLETYSIGIDLRINIQNLEKKIEEFNPHVVVFHPYYGASFTPDELNIIADIKNKGIIIVVDYTQCIYEENIISFADYVVASLRKWFDCPDGGYIYSNFHSLSDFSNLSEYTSFVVTQKDAMFLRGRYFENGDIILKDISIRLNKLAVAGIEQNIFPHVLSDFGLNRLLNSDMEKYGEIRFSNFRYLYDNVINNNVIKFVYADIDDIKSSPLYFPIYCENRDELQKQLAINKIYAPILWSVPEFYRNLDDDAKYIYEHILVIPIDQRYGIEDMQRVSSVINSFSSSKYN
ncbi:MAG: hypothetical protein SOR65_00270 [Odoribacter sp.]|nr:hypothetical protein [Odoribacter sp.]